MKTNESDTQEPDGQDVLIGQIRDEIDGWLILYEDRDPWHGQAYIRVRPTDAVTVEDRR